MFHRDQCLVFAACRKAAISPVTFGLRVNGVLLAQNVSTCFPFSRDPWQAAPKPVHMFSLSGLLGDYEKCLSLEKH